MKFEHKLNHLLSTNGATKNQFDSYFDLETDTQLEVLRSCGLNIISKHNKFYYETESMPIKEATFCIVDIETNGSKPENHQIIEIGAVKVKDGKIIDTFESFVKCTQIRKQISEITGIWVEDTKDAPKLEDVLKKFLLFLGDDIFIAHDIKFDYNYIDASLKQVGLYGLRNRGICSIDLAQRFITSYRYGLSYLNEFLNLYKDASHHRALSDAITTAELFKLIYKEIPPHLKTVEDLIRHSKHSKMKKRPKFDPLKEV